MNNTKTAEEYHRKGLEKIGYKSKAVEDFVYQYIAKCTYEFAVGYHEHMEENAWISFKDSPPQEFDKDYLVCVRNKNKPSGILIQDFGHYTSEGKWVKSNTWEDVVLYRELPSTPN